MKRRSPAFTLLILISLNGTAQIGIGTDNPSAKAVLHLESSDKGLIIPKMNSAQMDAMTVGGAPESGTLIYNTDVNEIFCFKNNKWYSMTPFQRERSNNVTKDTIRAASSGSGDPLVIPSLHVTTGYGIVPMGTIVMWSGTNPPDGWAICDGRTSNGYKTPDLKGRFIAGHDPNDVWYDYTGNLSEKGTVTGDIAGAAFVTLTTSQMPSHSHGGSVVAVGDHTHGVLAYSAGGVSAGPTGSGVFSADHVLYNNDGSWCNGCRSTQAGGGHSHTINPEGGGQAHENRPPYYVLAFIMRVK
jgi:microcystin-dependent protein